MKPYSRSECSVYILVTLVLAGSAVFASRLAAGWIVFGALLCLWLAALSAVRFVFSRILRREVKILQTIVDALPLPAAIMDRKLRAVAANGAFASLTAPKATSDANEPERSVKDSSYSSLLTRALDGEEIRFHRLQWDDHIYLAHVFPLRDGQRHILGAIAVYQDMTEISVMKNELNRMERLRLVGQMAASITHEIRNPLAVVRGFIQLMIEQTEVQSHREYFQLILEELDRAGGIVNDFLSLAQNRTIDKIPQNISLLVKGLSPLLLADTNMRGIELKMELADGLPLLLMDPKEIKQLIINLARNGMEAMPEGGTLSIATRRVGDSVWLQIGDSGCGIPKDLRDKLFQPFYTTKATGTGLGLAVCRSIAERHGGTISVESEEGRGTTFTIAFPVEDG